VSGLNSTAQRVELEPPPGGGEERLFIGRVRSSPPSFFFPSRFETRMVVCFVRMS